MGKMQIWWRFKYELAFDFMRVMINTVWNEYILYRWRHTYDKPYPDLLWNKTKISCSQCTISIEFHFIHILFQLQPKWTTGGETLLRLYCIYILYIVYYIYIIYIYINFLHYFYTHAPFPIQLNWLRYCESETMQAQATSRQAYVQSFRQVRMFTCKIIQHNAIKRNEPDLNWWRSLYLKNSHQG